MWHNIIEKNIISRILEDVVNYFKVYDFLKIKAKQYQAPKILVKSEAEYWFNILGDNCFQTQNLNYYDFEDGQIIEFKDFFLTDWCPKIPGNLWTKESQRIIKDSTGKATNILQINNELFYTFHPFEKKRLVTAGYGSIRVNPSENNPDNYMLMSMVSPGNYWHTDYGIPVVVSKNVYEEWKKYSAKGAPWIESCEGILIRDRNIPISKLIPDALGAKLPPELEDALTLRPNLPKCFIYFPSKLNLKFRYNDSHPKATAWTLFESNQSDLLQYTYIGFTPYKKEEENNAISFINEYVKNYNGKKILTDFDGILPRLEAEISLQNDPLIASKKQCRSILKKVDEYDKKLSKYYR